MLKIHYICVVERLSKFLSGMIDIRKVDYLFQEEFDTSQTIKAITGNKPLFNSWNVDELYNCSGKALLMSMNMGGKKYVIITKNGDSSFKIDYINDKLQNFYSQDNLNVNELVNSVDNVYKTIIKRSLEKEI